MRTKIILALAASLLADFTVAGTTCKQAAGKQVSGLAVYSPDTTTGPTLGKTFEIKWQPTAGYSTVSILLLKGPSTNVVPFSCIVDSIPNSGSYSWSVPSSGIDPQSTGYGIQIIADGSGDFQYSTQFGISGSSGSSSSGNVIAVTSTTRISGEKVTETIYHTSSTTTTSCPTTSSSSYHATAYSSHKIIHTHHSNHTSSLATGASSGSVKESVTPTKKPSVPASLPNVGGSGHEVTSTPVVAATPTSSPAAVVSKAAGAKLAALGSGLAAGLGAVAALAL